ncbi:2-oxo-4-hydroxy-4-carboxy-5-ureidoimidazoline decarboxylase [Salininema proteolyticum]|uniref:2-oxo-4-hydroxy-4-carboxy-5-ureidoimidazoline decarboxylase n=1 Tax=Salininema proteolyticum TaxID=1607685 RepID=A0ABV8U3L0_9ACTN
MWTLAEFNGLEAPTARAELLACCASPEWADAVGEARPFESLDRLLDFSDRAYAELDADQIDLAVKAHPEIGTRAEERDTESAWSRGEQSAAQSSDQRVKGELAEANAEYREKFGQVFLICATGLDSETILAEAKRRLRNGAAEEAAETASELRKIVQLRVGKLVTE